jgi:CHAT domain-containing protein
MARVQVVSRKDAASGLDYAERGRARTLLEGATGMQAVEPLAAESVQHRLPDHTAALFFMALDDRLLVWTVSAARVTVVDRPVSVAALRGRVDRMRWLIRQSNSESSHLTVDLESLFVELIGPIWSELSDVRTLAIVADGPLHAVPFAALINPKTGRYLVQDFVVMSAPSLSALVRSRHETAESSSPALRALVIGNPAHRRAVDEAPLPQLPFSADESAVVAATYPQSLLLTRQDATKRAVLENLSRFDIVHFAGHAVVNEQTPSLSRLLMATTGAIDDGTLFVSELADIRMDSVKLVVLAACSTLSGAVANGEGIASIARPFLESGAAMVVGTLWDVQDRAAAELFQRFHRLVAKGTPPALALVLVQRRLIEDATLNMRAPAQWAWAVSIGKLP